MKTVIIGAGTSAVAVADILMQDRNIKLVGFVGLEEEESIQLEGTYKDLPVLGGKDFLNRLIDDGVAGFVVGVGDNRLREKRFYEASSAGLVPVSAISPAAVIELSVRIGPGVIISPGVVLCHGVELGENSCIDPGVVIEGYTVIGENCSIAAGGIIGGKVKIGRGSALGARCTVSSFIEIGKNASIPTGAIVRENIPDQLREE